MRQRSRLAALCSISIILVVAGPLPVIASEVTETTNRGAPVVVLDQGSGPTDPAELEAFLDGVMAAHLATHNIAGATFSFVKNGELFFAKGWGWADREQEKPVVADESLFSIASVSKLGL